MKKTLSVIFAFILAFGILAVGASAESEHYVSENSLEFVSADKSTVSNVVYSAEATKAANIGEYSEVSVVVSKDADKIQFINSENKTITYTRDHANVISIVQSTDTTETWTISLKTYKPTENFRVIAKFGRTWVTDDNVSFSLNEKTQNNTKGIFKSWVEIPGALGSYAHVIVYAGGSPSKIQFRTQSGGTVTVSRNSVNVNKIVNSSAYYSDNTNLGPAERWEIRLKVSKPTENYTVAAKYNTGWSEQTGSIVLEAIVKSDFLLNVNIGQLSGSRYINFDVITCINTQRIIMGNIFEGTFDGFDFLRKNMRYYEDPHFEDYIDYISDAEEGEVWDLNHSDSGEFQKFLEALPLNETYYVSVQFADGSWAIAGYHVVEKSGRRIYEPVDINNPKKVNSAEVISPAVLGGTVDVKVTADEGASKIQFVNSSGSTITYTSSSETVKSIEQSGNNEIWTISLKVYRPADTYTVKAKYGREWTTDSSVQFVLNAAAQEDEYTNAVFSAKVTKPGALGDYAVVSINAGGSPSKIQFRTESGITETFTHDDENVTIEQFSSCYINGTDCGAGERWEIRRKVSKPSENFTVSAEYSTGWSDKTASFTLNELVKSDLTLSVGFDNDNDITRVLFYALTGNNTKRIIMGNVFEGVYDGVEFSREEMHDWQNNHYYWQSGDAEKWMLSNYTTGSVNPSKTVLTSIPLNEIHYLSAEMEDGSWAVAGYHAINRNGHRYYEPAEIKDIQKVYFAEVNPQGALNEYVDAKVTVGTGASCVQFINSAGEVFTFSTESESVKSIETQPDATDIWTISIKVYEQTEVYNVKAKYGSEWTTDDDVQFVVIAQ